MVDDFTEFLRQQQDGEQGRTWTDAKYFWIADEHHGYIPVQQIECNDEGLRIKRPDATTDVVPSAMLLPANSSRYDKHEDMAELGELNEATILHCLKSRHQSSLIYTYSGLFLVAINPYKTLPIYSPQVIEWFKGRPRQDRPPHIYAVAEAALADMLRSQQHQSILITGESGAGKTENTKKVIQYLTTVTGGQNGSLEQKILSTNPILEAFGNAQTGKFVRIAFSAEGKIVGADIERYLLEKSRITHRSPLERSFHVFYQLLSAPQQFLDEYGLIADPQAYSLLKQSNVHVHGVDDVADFALLLESFKTIELSAGEVKSIFKVLSAILHLGNIQLAGDDKDQAGVRERAEMETLCGMLHVDCESFERALLNPILRVGKETIVQSRDVAQVAYSIESLCRTLYERLFSWLVDRINKALWLKSGTGQLSIGVLDIAGFEVFAKNSFEQLCINYTNEKLQQFYNHHMFVQEQEEYKKEHVEWTFADFGLDLQPAIDLLEKSNPVGVFACLDEDCIVPKATDRSFTDKLLALWRGKTSKLEALRFNHQGFAIEHYAGRVEYQTDGWLDKNKDPVNDTLLQVLAQSDDPLVSLLSSDELKGKAGGQGLVKKGLFRTVGQRHRESLMLLMQQLGHTRPHFVRCIVPNGEKRPGCLDAKLVLEQLKCNGVFEGIRVCRNGYPGRIPIHDFVCTYRMLLADGETRGLDPKAACRRILQGVGLEDAADYKLGLSKVFLKNGRTTRLDDLRDRVLTGHALTIQRYSKMKISKRLLQKRDSQAEALRTIAACLPRFVQLKRSPWWLLFHHVRPLLNVARAENRISDLEQELSRLSLDREQQEQTLRAELNAERQRLSESEAERRDLERSLKLLELTLCDSNEVRDSLIQRNADLEGELATLRDRVHTTLEPQIASLQGKVERACADQQVLCTALAGKQQECSEARAKLEEAGAETTRLLQQQQTLNGQIAELESGMERLKVQLVEAVQSRQAFEATVAGLEDERGRREGDLLRRLAQQESLHLSIKEGLEKQIAEAKAVEEHTERRSSRHIAALERQLAEGQQSATVLKEQLASRDSQIEELHARLGNEQRTLAGAKRDKERAEAHVRDLEAALAEHVGREEQRKRDAQLEQDRRSDLQARLFSAEEGLFSAEHQVKALDAKIQEQAATITRLTGTLREYDQRTKALEEQTADTSNAYHNARDELAVSAEKLKLAVHCRQLLEAQLKDEQLKVERQCDERRAVERQLREAQLRIIDLEAKSGGGVNLGQALERLEQESKGRCEEAVQRAKLERLVRELQLEKQRREDTRDAPSMRPGGGE